MRRQRHQRRRNRSLGIRSTPQAVETLTELDRTIHGVYWFDLTARHPVASRVKRLFDVIASLTLIVLCAPLFLFLLALIMISSRGDPIFAQRRIGFRCNEFLMYKFRTMVTGAEKLEAKLAEESGREFLKIEKDSRVTMVGRILRKFSLDELPQLFNVLEGTMSLVGPRPLLISDLQKFPLRGQMRRFSVKPGITGLWQVSGRSAMSDLDRMQLDREYVNRWSLWLDLKILLKTFGAVISARGAT